MKNKFTGLKRKLLMTPLLVSLAVAPSLNVGSSFSKEYKLKQAEGYFLNGSSRLEEKVEETFDPFSLKSHYLPEKEVGSYLNTYKKLVPEEFSLEDINKIIEIESRFDKNAYREDTIKRKNNVKIIKQGGLMQIRENTYGDFEKKVPYHEGVFDINKNLEVGLKNLQFIQDYNVKFNPYWNEIGLKDKQKYIIAGHNWGIGNLKRNDWDLSKVPPITKDFFNKFYNRN